MNEEKRTALIVDDEDIVLDIDSLMLQKIGLNILKAGNSADTCQLYDDKKEHS
jgi:response regulator RpfG family c-di-GMP phosphodiesterase